MRTLFISITFYLIAINSFCQNFDKDLLIGEWRLAGFSTLTYSKNIDDAVCTTDIGSTSLSNKLIFDSTTVKISSGERYYTREQTFEYSLRWTNDQQVYIVLYGLKGRKKVKEGDLNLIKLNNSVLTIRQAVISEPIEIFNYQALIFHKLEEDSLINEFDFEGKWFVKEQYEDIRLIDTLLLQRDSCTIVNETGELAVLLEFASDNLKELNTFRLNETVIKNKQEYGILDGVYIDIPSTWMLDRKQKAIHFQSYELGDISFHYQFNEIRELILTKIKE